MHLTFVKWWRTDSYLGSHRLPLIVVRAMWGPIVAGYAALEGGPHPRSLHGGKLSENFTLSQLTVRFVMQGAGKETLRTAEEG
jgi:hypothetical protein